MILESQQKVSKIIFLICITISLISFLSLIFPAFLIELSINNSILDESNRTVNVYELGIWALPIIFGNMVFFGLFTMYKLKKFPYKFNKIIYKISLFDISKKTCIIVLLVLFSIYFIFSFDEFQREEFEFGDYVGVVKDAKEWEFKGNSIISPEIRYLFLHISIELFDNIRILPFIASISLLLITFFLTLELTKKRISGVISFAILLQSNLFLMFDTTSSYENFWTAFYFLSLYLIFKKPVGSHIAFILGMLTKPLVLTLLPINLFAIFTSELKKSRKIILWITYSIIILVVLIAFFTNNITHVTFGESEVGFNFNKLISSMNEFGNSLRFDGLILILFIPTIIILFTKKGNISKSINLIFLGIVFSILSQPLMFSMIEMTLQPYRFIPVIVFCAISVGMIFSNSKTLDQK